MKTHCAHNPPRRFRREKGLSRRIFFAIALGVCLPPGEALTQSPTQFSNAAPKIRFEHLSVDQGLSNGVVNAILQDRMGFMWFGTQQGLNKYDGFQLRIFQHDITDTTSLPNDHITALFEDRQGQLWIGTAGNFLVRFDPLTERFLKYQFETDPEMGAADLKIVSVAALRSIAEDSSGALWLITQDHQLLRCRLEHANRIARLEQIPMPDRCEVFSLCFEASNIAWMAKNCGLQRLALSPFTNDSTHSRAAKSAAGRNIEMKLTPVRTLELNAHASYRLNGNPITDVCRDGAGVFWLITDRGLIRFDQHQGSFTSYSFPDTALRFGGDNRITLDSRTNVWVATDRGLLFFSAKNQPINIGETAVFNGLRTPAAPLYVQALLADRTGSLWIGTGSKGLGRLDLQHGSLRLYQALADDPAKLPHRSISALFESREGTLWVLTPGALSRFNREADNFTTFYFDRARSRESEREALPGCLMQDSGGHLWLGSETHGLVRFDPARERFQSYKHDPSDGQSLSHDLVRTILEDPAAPDRFLWVGTNEGLNCFDRRTEKFMHFTEKHGLSHRCVYGMLADRSGNLWISTNNGISRFNPKTLAFRKFTITDGLQSREFNTGAYYQNKAGEMFFGGINGFNAFYPEEIQVNNTPPAVAITDFKLFNESVSFGRKHSPLTRPVAHASELNLSYRDRVIAFEFVALDYNTPAENSYAYMMENFDKDWVMNGAKRTAQYTNLDPGAYVFRVKAANADGVWHEKGTAIKIHIPPPPWERWWAYVLYALFTVTAFLGVRRYELNRLQLKNQVGLEHLEAEKLKEIDHLKSRFFANISHEFRTPLTLILGPLEHVSTKMSDPGLKYQLQTALHNGHRLLRLISQLLDLSKLDAGGMKLKASRDNLVAFLKGIVFTFKSAAQQKGIMLEFHTDYDDLEAYYDVEKLEQVFYNLMSNAIKFVPPNSGGKISVKVVKAQASFLEKLPPNVECARITVRDTGIGIPAELLPRVFDRFYRVEEPRARVQEGTGIGLALAKEMVELHYGQISVSSEEGKGSSFVVILPLGRAHLKEEEVVEEVTSDQFSVFSKEQEAARRSSKRDAVTPSLQPTIHSSIPFPASSNADHAADREMILIVEDNDDVRAFLRQQLGASYEVREAVDGQEGFIRAAECIPDLVITDVMMPKMDGHALCHALKEEEKTSHIPVIMLSAKASPESKLEGLETGADDYLTKPFSSKELLVRVRNLIEQRRKLRARFSREVILKPNEIAITPTDERFLTRIKEAVEKNLSDEDFSVEHLSHEVGMSRTQLHRKLKALTDQSASEFILSMRLQRALELLKQNAGTVAEIAYMVGFNTPNYFAKSFRKQFGCSPSEYKMRLAQENS